jgi:hypothetical protein
MEKEFAGFQGPAETLPRNGKGDLEMKSEWIAAIRRAAWCIQF